MEGNLIRPNEFTEPIDLVNLRLKCRDCNSPHVIYYVTVPAPGWDLGPYCYKCLLARCGATYRIPVPMEVDLMDRLQTDLGIFQAKKYFMGVDRIGG